MHLSVGMPELILSVLLGLLAILLRMLRSKHRRTAFVIFVCCCGATLLSPADLASTLILTLAFWMSYQCGSRFSGQATASESRTSETDSPGSSWINPFRLGAVVFAFAAAAFTFGQMQLWQGPEPALGHQVFRAWAASWVGTILIVLAAVVWGYHWATKRGLQEKDMPT